MLLEASHLQANLIQHSGENELRINPKWSISRKSIVYFLALEVQFPRLPSTTYRGMALKTIACSIEALGGMIRLRLNSHRSLYARDTESFPILRS